MSVECRYGSEAGELGNKSTVEKIKAMFETGTFPEYEELKQKVPPGMLEMLRISGLGPKKARLIHDKLGVNSLEKLEEAAMAKKFERIEAGKKIAGVCAGLADYFDLDVTLVRVLFVILTLASGGVVLLAYFLLWLLAPTAARPRGETQQPSGPSNPHLGAS